VLLALQLQLPPSSPSPLQKLPLATVKVGGEGLTNLKTHHLKTRR
jgi:hypothetical protein